MKVKSIKINNCKSYADEQVIEFDKNFNIFVGPNGGGKSNTLDILTVVIYGFFLEGYHVRKNTRDGRTQREIMRSSVFNPENHLEAFMGQEDSSTTIEIDYIVQEEDIENIKIIQEYEDEFKIAGRTYHSIPSQLNFIENFAARDLSVGQVLSYKVVDNKLERAEMDETHTWFQQYLSNLNLLYILSEGSDLSDAHLHSPTLFFSPYRSPEDEGLEANISKQNFHQLLNNYRSTTSRNQSSLIQLASHYLGRVRRANEVAEYNGDESETVSQFREVETELISKYIKRLGYENWSTRWLSKDENIIELVLEKDDKRFDLKKASSGEKEILNFLLGTISFRVTGGVVIVDEPELHLHPRWQSLLRDMFRELSEEMNMQFIVSTHSPVFLTPETLRNVRRVSAPKEGKTIVNSMEGGLDSERKKSLLHMVNSHNNEKMFFSDHVVLVEGISDRLIISKLVRYLQEESNTEIVEVMAVHGKHNIAEYKKFLESMNVKVSTIADRDYLNQVGGSEIKELFEVNYGKIGESALKDKNSKDKKQLAIELEQAIEEGNVEELEEFWGYIKSRHTQLKEEMTEDEEEKLSKCIEQLKQERVFILSNGELEDYLPEGCNSIDEIIKLTTDENFQPWVDGLGGEGMTLIDIVSEVLSD